MYMYMCTYIHIYAYILILLIWNSWLCKSKQLIRFSKTTRLHSEPLRPSLPTIATYSIVNFHYLIIKMLLQHHPILLAWLQKRAEMDNLTLSKVGVPSSQNIVYLGQFVGRRVLNAAYIYFFSILSHVS